MIGRIVSIQGSPDAIRQAQSALTSQGLAVLKTLAGLEGLHAFANADAGRVAVVTLWKDEASAKAAVQAMGFMQQRVTALGLSFKLDDYDVVA